MPATDTRRAIVEGAFARPFAPARQAARRLWAGDSHAHCPHFLESAQAPNTLPETLDATLLIPYTSFARERLEPIEFHVDITNVNRCVGTMLGSAVTAQHPEGLPYDFIRVNCSGSGGMSFGAFLPKGIMLTIAGEANDYFGKGLSGGTVAVAPSSRANFRPEENVIVGNVAFYGATSGTGFVNGLAGQRFAARNSGASLVVEGIGDNGCEYMTGGLVLVLGEVGINFAAGMNGGVAYVYDAAHTLESHCNRDLVDILEPDRSELAAIRELIEAHVRVTMSPLGVMMLYRFDDIAHHFKKVIPDEYRKMLAMTTQFEEEGCAHEEAQERAFELLRAGA